MNHGLDLRAKRVAALLNTTSGSCDVQAEQALAQQLAEAGIQPVRVWCGGGGDVERGLQEADAH